MPISPIPSRSGSDIEWFPPTAHDPNITIYVSQVRAGEPGSGWPPKVQIMINSRGTEATMGQTFWLSDEGLKAFASAITEAIKWRNELTQAVVNQELTQAVVNQELTA